MPTRENRLAAILERHHAELLDAWMKEQQGVLGRHRDLVYEAELKEQSRSLLRALQSALHASLDINTPHWTPVRDQLGELSRSRAKQGFTPTETAMFVFSLKPALGQRLRAELEGRPELIDELQSVNVLLDKLGLHTFETFQKAREEVIARQQNEMLELSTPVVQLWDRILALPLIGTLDSRRTQTVMESLLETIVATGAEIAIIDITGVPTVDTLTAQHLLRTVTATRLMGADCIISGIRPQIAQTIVHLGVDLGDVLTKASLASALDLALKRRGMHVTKRPSNGS
jgi:rsbT co-antagonist protein RsbR